MCSKKWAKPGQSLLDLVSGTGAHDRVIRDDPRRVEGDRHHDQPVVEGGLLNGVGKDGRRRACLRLVCAGGGRGRERRAGGQVKSRKLNKNRMVWPRRASAESSEMTCDGWSME